MTSHRTARERYPTMESTPLLHQSLQLRPRTPLPLRQLGILALVGLCEPIAFTVVFPFVNEMMQYLKVTDKTSEIGFYSGFVDSIFAVGQLMTAFQWGKLSDRIGRRPVFFIGLSGLGASIFLFGLSKSLLWAVLSRGIGGALCSNLVIIQSVFGELTDHTNEAQALPLIPLIWSVGCITGSLVGGTFSNPVARFPTIFGSFELLRRYPYFLPCFMASSIVLISLTIGFLFLKETLPSKIRTLDTSETSPQVLPRHSISASAILQLPLIPWIFGSLFLLNLLYTSFDVLFILVSYTPIHLGGLSRSPAQIGYALAGGGVFSLVAFPFGLPKLQRRFGIVPLYQVLVTFWPICFLCIPLLNVLARVLSDSNGQLAGRGPILVWIGIGIITIIARAATMCFSLNVLLVKHAAPNRQTLGSTYGLGYTIGGVARAFTPTFASSMFALSIEKGLLGGQLVWIILVALGILGVLVATRLRDHSEPAADDGS